MASKFFVLSFLFFVILWELGFPQGLLQTITNLVILVIIAYEKKFGVVHHHPLPLRIYWALNFFIACMFTVSALSHLFSRGQIMDQNMKIDDIVSVASFPLYIFLFIVAVKGSSRINSTVEEGGYQNTRQETDESNVSGYAKASLMSRAVLHWMNPILSKGYKSPLEMEDVPSLPPQLQAQTMAELFELHWPKETETLKNPVRTMLLRGFWKDLVFTALLAVVRLAVMYIGPVLINRFITFSSSDRRNLNEGFHLVLILLFAKVVEVLNSHQYNFLSQKLGMQIRSTLITALFKKGLRLSYSSRQAHGVGQIVNYMSVDCQQLSELVCQLHTLWMMPFQVGVGLLLLYIYLGVSAFVSLAAVVVVMFATLIFTRKNKLFQVNVMKNRDLRMKAMTELLKNMRVIKFQAWEEHFLKKIQSCRRKEYSWLSKFMYLVSGNLVLLWSVPIVIAALTFGVATLFSVPLDASTVFTATSVFKILHDSIQHFPQTLNLASQALISLERLDMYFMSRELEDEMVEREGRDDDGGIAVEVREGKFAWDDEGGEHVLEDVNFKIKKGELAAIVGTVGSGKSSLLASVLGELRKTSGKVRVYGSTAYVAQTSWIQNATIQENIMFGSPMDDERYNTVIRVCSLEKDFEIMEHGDQTEIGERGINLSGGQKQRIQLARAIYQDSDIYLLDDIFSAVDAHTGIEIFKECVRGFLKGKTILLVTHQVDFLHNADLILVLRDGKIVQSGKYEQLRQSEMDFSALVTAHKTSMELVEANTAISGLNLEEDPESPKQAPMPITNKDLSHYERNGQDRNAPSKPNDDSAKLIEEEEKEKGRVSLNVYKQYCTEVYGWWGVGVVLLTSLLWQLCQMASDYWLAYETSDGSVFVPSLFVSIYSIIAVISCVLLGIRSLLVAFLGLKTAESFFNQILNSIFHAPMSFFDTTPSGRVLSRVS